MAADWWVSCYSLIASLKASSSWMLWADMIQLNVSADSTFSCGVRLLAAPTEGAKPAFMLCFYRSSKLELLSSNF